MFDVVIAGGTVLIDAGMIEADIGISGRHIEEIGHNLSGRCVINAAGAWVGPGFVDIHTHLREPGQTWKEDIASGSASAAAGGYTAIVAMPNTDPPIDTPDLAESVAARGREVGLVDVVPSACLTVGRRGEVVSPIGELAAGGVTLFTDDGDSVANASVLLEAMELVRRADGVVSQHAVDGPLSEGGAMHAGSVSRAASLLGIPPEAEEIVVARDLALARRTGVRYHVQHLSSAVAVDLIRAAKGEGLAVSCEVTPHHLLFTDEWVPKGGSSFKMMPPLRSADDRDALRSALLDGTIDVVATDHAPHAPHEKEGPLSEAPNGVLGLEWAAAAFMTACSPEPHVFFDRMSVAPARIAGVEGHGALPAVGGRANLVVFEPTVRWTPTETLSKSSNAPYFGIEVTGLVLATLHDGIPTHGTAR